jgi:transposase InsO family protein
MEGRKRCSKQPFMACAHLLCFVACAANVCQQCEPDITYFVQNDGVVRKRRKPKQRESSLASRPSGQTWQIKNVRARTSKHKQAAVHANVLQHSKHGKDWCPDSGATVSVTNNLSNFVQITDSNPNIEVSVANGQRVKVTCIGTVRMVMHDTDCKPYTVLLENVMYSPHFHGNLLSVEELYRQHKIATIFRGSKACFLTPDNVIIPFSSENRRYKFRAHSVQQIPTPELWHRRLCHAGTAAIKRMVSVLPELRGKQFDFSKCDACLQGGAHKLPVGNSYKQQRRVAQQPSFRKIATEKKRQRFTYFGERLSIDLCSMPKSYSGCKYMVIIHDSFSSEIWTDAIKDKEAETILESIKRFLYHHEKQLINGIGKIHSDNGSEFRNDQLEQLCTELSSERSYTVPYLPSQNPYAERANSTVLRPLRTIIAECGDRLEPFWPQLAEQIALVHNVLCDDDGISPYERVHGEKYEYDQLRAPGCLCYYLVPERDRASKLSPRAVHAIYLGLDPERNGHRVWIPSMQRLTTAHHLVFNEHRYYQPSLDRSRVSFDDSAPQPTDQPIGVQLRGMRGGSSDDNDDDGYTEGHDRVDTPATIGDGNASDRAVDNPRHGDVSGSKQFWNEDHCENSECLYPRGHAGPCSHEEYAARQPRRRKEPERFVYETCTRCDECCFHEWHSGNCCSDNGKELQSKCARLESAVADADSVLDFDPMETSFQIYLDDVGHEVLRVDLSELGDIPCPKTYEDTQKLPPALVQRWNESMREEHESLAKINTWEYVSRFDPRLRGRTPTKSRWVYAIKYKRDGTIERFKSRFVVCGYSQRHGVDYDRAFSSTLRASSFRALLAIAAGKQLRVMQFDVKNAFVQAEMDDVDMFVEPAKGQEVYEIRDGKSIPCYCGSSVRYTALSKPRVSGKKHSQNFLLKSSNSFGLLPIRVYSVYLPPKVKLSLVFMSTTSSWLTKAMNFTSGFTMPSSNVFLARVRSLTGFLVWLSTNTKTTASTSVTSSQYIKCLTNTYLTTPSRANFLRRIYSTNLIALKMIWNVPNVYLTNMPRKLVLYFILLPCPVQISPGILLYLLSFLLILLPSVVKPLRSYFNMYGVLARNACISVAKSPYLKGWISMLKTSFETLVLLRILTLRGATNIRILCSVMEFTCTAA